MKLGFALKKTKKSGLLAAGGVVGGADGGSTVARAFEAAPVKRDAAAERVYVTDFDPAAVAPGGDANKPTLVIPLRKTNEWKAVQALTAAEISGDAEAAPAKEEEKDAKETQEETTTDEPLTEDERAARQLLADAKAQQNGGSEERTANHSLVIKMKRDASAADDPLAEKRAKLFKLDGESKDAAAAPKGVPILQQNAVPGMDELADVTEKYRHDVALRPDALDVHSEVYEAIPVEDFGAAMLRGMGWKGAVEEDKNADDPKPRQKLLGLGATAKPKLAGGDKNGGGHHKARRTEQQPRSNGLNQREDAKSSSSKSDKRKSDDDDKYKREKESSRASSRSRERGRDKERERSSRASDRDRDDDRRRDRDRDDKSGRDRDRERDRSKSRERGRDRKDDRDRKDSRERRDDRGCRDDREKRKRSRSRDRSSDRKKSSSSRR